MLTAVAVPIEVIPSELVRRHRLTERLHVYDDLPEYQFHFTGKQALLPVLHEGRLVVARWGCRRDESRVLPSTAWTRTERIESGYWQDAGAEEVQVPASRAFENGYWYELPAPIRAVLVREGERLHVFVVCEPSSHFHEVRTRSAWMPSLTRGRL